MPDVMVGNCNEMGSAKAVLGRAAVFHNNIHFNLVKKKRHFTIKDFSKLAIPALVVL